MPRMTLRPDSRRSLPATVAASAVSLLVLALAAGPAAAAPTVNATVTDGTLHILGSTAPDRLTLRLSGLDPNQLQVDVGDDGSADFSFERNEIAKIAVDARPGDDALADG